MENGNYLNIASMIDSSSMKQPPRTKFLQFWALTYQVLFRVQPQATPLSPADDSEAVPLPPADDSRAPQMPIAFGF